MIRQGAHGGLNARTVSFVAASSLLIVAILSGCVSMPEDTPEDEVWDDLGEPGHAAVAVKHLDRWGYVDYWGGVIVEPQFAQASPFSEGRAPVRLNQRWGFIDKGGRYVVRPRYDMALGHTEGLAAVKGSRGWGYVSLSGTLIIKDEYDEARPFAQGLAAVRIANRWG